jgi:hypothetical protein
MGKTQISTPFDAAMPRRDGLSFSSSSDGHGPCSRVLELAEPTDDLPSRRAEACMASIISELPSLLRLPSLFLHSPLALHQHHANGLRVCVHSLSFALFCIQPSNNTSPRSLTRLAFLHSLFPLLRFTLVTTNGSALHIPVFSDPQPSRIT